MDNIKKWFSKKAAMLSLSFANVEKNMLGQRGESLENDAKEHVRHTKGQLADSLVNGEITQEVIDLRWKIYKILKQQEGTVTKFVGYDEDNMPIIETYSYDTEEQVKKIKIDPTDSYPLEMVVDNTSITLDVKDSIDNKLIKLYDEPEENKLTVGDVEETIISHGSISSNDFFSTSKGGKSIIVGREFFPKFNIENFTEKVNVRTIDASNKLIEFYVSKYPDELNRTSKLFINEIKKAMLNPSGSNMLEIKEIGFITNNTLGKRNYLEFKYEVTSFDKITEFNGYYLIKFIAKVTTDGFDVLEKFKSESLEIKYKNKEKKKYE
jgi:hypothetical protein